MIPQALGAHAAWNAMLFGEANQQTVSYLASQFETAKNYITDAGRGFIERAKSMFNMANGSEAIDFARQVVSKIDNSYASNRIQPVRTIEQFRAASPVMQRWIMAEPTIRERYFKQTCDGYAETYHSTDTGIGENHLDWRMVMTGIVVEEGDTWRATQYFDELDPSDRPLTFGEKGIILAAHEALRAYCEMGDDDPTSPIGGKF